jgi:phosphatidylserine decarboxylase
MKIHKEGYNILIGLFVLLALANFVLQKLVPVPNGPGVVVLFISVIIYLFVLWFFRVPARPVHKNDNHVVAPADGKIVAIEEVDENEHFNERKLQVSIFMSPLNVHVNIFPVSGIIKYYKYHPGKYLVAWHPKASDSNERSTVVIGNGRYSVLVRQIAGAVARRIVCYARPGENVQQGEELGFIKFGSRVDLFLPVDVKLNVKLGEKVIGKSSIIATFE